MAVGSTGLKTAVGSVGLKTAVGSTGLKTAVGPVGLKTAVGSTGLKTAVGPAGLKTAVGSTGLKTAVGPVRNMSKWGEPPCEKGVIINRLRSDTGRSPNPKRDAREQGSLRGFSECINNMPGLSRLPCPPSLPPSLWTSRS